jgi:CheY-like chemotaxis protein
VLVLRHEVAEKDAARIAQSGAQPTSARSEVAQGALAKPQLILPPVASPTAESTQASRKWVHQLRNHLNTAGLAMQVAQTQMARGEIADADAKLQLAMAQMNALEATLANGPAASGVRQADPLAAFIDRRPESVSSGEATSPATSPATVTSPAVQPELSARPADPVTASASAAQPTALVVEDNANESALLAFVLRQNGFRVATASDGCHALDYLATHKRPDVVLLDMRMPRCDGPTTISAIRSNPQLSGLRVVAVSGSRSSEIGVSTGPQGVDRWFCKPVDPRRLVHELKHDLQVTTGATL